MLSGWYCRSLLSEQAEGQQMDSNGSGGSEEEQDQDQITNAGTTSNANKNVDHRAQYKYLKRKLKYLIYENEFFQDALRSNQRRLVKVTRDRAFLLDRLMQYEKPENTSSESCTESSEDEITKKRKLEQDVSVNAAPGTATGSTRGRKKKTAAASTVGNAEKAPNDLHSTLDQSTVPSSSITEEDATNISMEPQFNNCVQAEYNN